MTVFFCISQKVSTILSWEKGMHKANRKLIKKMVMRLTNNEEGLLGLLKEKIHAYHRLHGIFRESSELQSIA